MSKFEIVSSYLDKDIQLPQRGTFYSAGYDIAAAEDIIIPSYFDLMSNFRIIDNKIYTLNEMASLTKTTKIKPTLVPTGLKCKLSNDEYLKLVVRSSTPLKYWLIMANGVGK